MMQPVIAPPPKNDISHISSAMIAAYNAGATDQEIARIVKVEVADREMTLPAGYFARTLRILKERPPVPPKPLEPIQEIVEPTAPVQVKVPIAEVIPTPERKPKRITKATEKADMIKVLIVKYMSTAPHMWLSVREVMQFFPNEFSERTMRRYLDELYNDNHLSRKNEYQRFAKGKTTLRHLYKFCPTTAVVK